MLRLTLVQTAQKDLATVVPLAKIRGILNGKCAAWRASLQVLHGTSELQKPRKFVSFSLMTAPWHTAKARRWGPLVATKREKKVHKTSDQLIKIIF